MVMVMLVVVVVCKYVDEKWWFISVKWPHCLVYLSSTLTGAKQINSSVQETGTKIHIMELNRPIHGLDK